MLDSKSAAALPQSRDKKTISLHGYLIILIVAAVAPLLALAGVMTVRLSHDRRKFRYAADRAKRD